MIKRAEVVKRFEVAIICMTCQAEWYKKEFDLSPAVIRLNDWAEEFDGDADELPCLCTTSDPGLRVRLVEPSLGQQALDMAVEMDKEQCLQASIAGQAIENSLLQAMGREPRQLE